MFNDFFFFSLLGLIKHKVITNMIILYVEWWAGALAWVWLETSFTDRFDHLYLSEKSL
jgi:hypothetical protein